MSSVAEGKIGVVAVAKRARVSTATVSRVLNGSSLVAAATRDRVLQVAEKVGYMPDPRFRFMGQNRSGCPHNTGNIGVLVRGLSQADLVANPYYMRLFWSIEQTARRLQRHILLSTLENETYLPDFVTDMKVDGVLFIDYVDPPLIQRIRKLMPAVMVNCLAEGSGISMLMADEASGVRQGLQYLRSLGHQKICYFDVHDSESVNHQHAERAAAFASLTSQLGMNQTQSVILQKRLLPMNETARLQLLQWRDSGWRPTAILCGSDFYALGFLNAARELGIDVPAQLSVIGADDTEICEHATPQLTSIRQPFEAMGASAVEILGGLVDGDDVPQTTQRFDVTLVRRQSCAACGGKKAY